VGVLDSLVLDSLGVLDSFVNKKVVALANKIARIGWRIVARGEHYDVNKAFGSAHPAG